MTNAMIKLIDNIETNDISQSLNKIQSVQTTISKTLKQGQDYDTIPGTQKPTLLKPGAEKILLMFGIRSEYEIITQIEDYDKGIFAYTVRCILSHGAEKITEGLGSCNSKEDRYRYRWVRFDEIPAGIDPEGLAKKVSDYGPKYDKYQIENQEIFTQVNTILKMAKKRAQIDATLTVASLSEIFTQDLEDLKNFQTKEEEYTINEQTAGNIKVDFGKFKGYTLQEIAAQDISYLDWLSKNAKKENIKKAAEIVYKQDDSKDQYELAQELEAHAIAGDDNYKL